MKKYLMTVVAALAAASFTSCTNEIDMFESLTSEKATIDLNITNDNVMNTRAVSDVADPSSWYITVGNNNQILVSGLSAKKYEAGKYNITVSNYTNEAAAITANDAYYEGTNENEELKKGSNPVTVACGTAKNCRVKADLTNLVGFNQITDAKLTVSQASVSARELTTANTTGYFYAGTGKTISYMLSYTYTKADNSTVDKSASGSISNPAAATEYQVKVVTNSNGTITLTVTYDTEFTTTVAETITIDAATGEKANNQ